MNKDIVKKYFDKYFKAQYLKEDDYAFKALVKILNKKDKADHQPARTLVDAEKSCESCVHFVLRDFGFAGCDNGGICQHKDRFQPKDTRL